MYSYATNIRNVSLELLCPRGSLSLGGKLFTMKVMYLIKISLPLSVPKKKKKQTFLMRNYKYSQEEILKTLSWQQQNRNITEAVVATICESWKCEL